MAESLFLKESPSDPWANESQNVCVVGLDGKGWTSQMLVASVSPWIRELMSSLPPHLDHCIILPDISFKDVSSFFHSLKLSCEDSGDVADLPKIAPSGQVSANTEATFEILDEKVMTSKSKFQKSLNMLEDASADQSFCLGGYMKKEKEECQIESPDRTLAIATYDEGKLKCEQCEVVFLTKFILKRHILRSGGNCSRVTNKKAVGPRKNKTKYSKRHIRTIMKSPNIGSYNLDKILEGFTIFPCNKCDKKCFSLKALKKHNEKMHPVVYQCDYCKYTGSEQRHLTLHFQTIHGEMPVSCDLCDKKYKYKNIKSLRRHTLADHDGVRFPCDQCDYKAKSKHCLRIHNNAVHEKITIYCDKCEKTYTNSRNLRQHQVSVHEGMFYMCDQCEYKATQKRILQNHIEKVHGGVFYQCDKCEYNGTQKRNFSSHIEKYHNALKIDET